MFEGLQKKWKVSSSRLIFILLTFAIGGSLTGYLGKKIMQLTGIESTAAYIPVYIILITIIWPLMVLAVSIPFGQFVFFKKYIGKMGKRLSGKKMHASPHTLHVGEQEIRNLPDRSLAAKAYSDGTQAGPKPEIRNPKPETRNISSFSPPVLALMRKKLLIISGILR